MLWDNDLRREGKAPVAPIWGPGPDSTRSGSASSEARFLPYFFPRGAWGGRSRPMLPLRLIERKRDGGRIEPAEWRACIRAYVAGDMPDYQMAALLMASFLNGLDAGETVALMEAMLGSGARLPLPVDGRPRVDKHSTGGVG